ncbi:MAG: autotransporter outer membrane beta-barrel domain-containing protein [Rhizobiaceae bacterium]|nr:autotransporter outer membrane beta-barrel domain-containing protein [Rhizobiaceae bacterium]
MTANKAGRVLWRRSIRHLRDLHRHLASSSSSIVLDMAYIRILPGAAVTAGLLSIAAHADSSVSTTPPNPAAGLLTSIDAIDDAATVKKAQLSDFALATITAYRNADPLPDAPAPTIGSLLNAGIAITETVDGISVISDVNGAAAIGHPSGSAVQLNVRNGGSIVTSGNQNPGFRVEGSGNATEINLESDGRISTTGTGSPALQLGGGHHVVGFSEAGIDTSGNQSAGIDVALGGNGMFLLESNGRPADRPVIQTIGNYAPGVNILDSGSSTFAFDINDGPDIATEPGFQTQGNFSPLFNVLGGGQSSLSFSSTNSSFATQGNWSTGMNFCFAESSDMLILLESLSAKTTGDNAPVLATRIGSGSITNLVAIDVDLTTNGDGSAAIHQRTNGNSYSHTVLLADSSVVTTGSDSPGIFLDSSVGSAESSNRTVTLLNSTITTGDDRSSGFFVNGLGFGSAMETILTGIEISTVGDDSRGLLEGSVGASSAFSSTIEDSTLSTMGMRSTALELGAAQLVSSVRSIEMQTVELSTDGDNSAAAFLRLFPETPSGVPAASTTTLSWDDVTLNTEGNSSPGFLIGTTDIATGYGAAATAMSMAIDGDNTSITTLGANSPGLIVNGFGDEVTNSDFTLQLENQSVSTAGTYAFGMQLNVMGGSASEFISTSVLNQIDIETQGVLSFGLSVGNFTGFVGDSNTVNVTTFFGNVTVDTQGDFAIGFLLDPIGTDNVNSIATTTGVQTTITTSGTFAPGLILGNGLGLSVEGTRTPLVCDTPPNHCVTINTAFDAAETTIGAGPLVSISNLALSNISATTSGAYSDALQISSHSALTISSDVLGTAAPDGGIFTGTIDNFDGFVATGEGSRAVRNYGIIHGGDDGIILAPGTVGNFANDGTIMSSGDVALTYGATDDTFELGPEGIVIGRVEAGQGTDTLVLGGDIPVPFVGEEPDPDEGTFDHTLIGTQYIDFEQIVLDTYTHWELTGGDTASALLPVSVERGALIVNSNLTGLEVTTSGNGALSGSGSVGTLLNNGIFTPGGDGTIGTFGIASDMTLGASGVLAVDVTSTGTSDVVNVTGVASLSGALVVNGIGYPVGYPGSQNYTIINADSVSGTFSNIYDNLPDVNFLATYNAANVVIGYTGAGSASDNSAPDRPDDNPLADLETDLIAAIEATDGAISIGEDEDGDTSLLLETDWNTALASNAPELPNTHQVFLSPDAVSDKSIYPNTLQAAGHASRLFADTVQRRAMLGALPDPSDTSASAEHAYGTSGNAGATQRYSGWGSLLGSRTQVDAGAAVSGYESDTGGFALGGDAAFEAGNDSLMRLGFAFGNTQSNVSGGLSSADIGIWHIGAYGTFEKGPLIASAALTYGFGDYDISRVIPITGSPSALAQGDTDGDTFAVSLAASYDIADTIGLPQENNLRLAPIVRFDHVNAHLGGYTETGAGILNQSVSASDWSRSWAGVGIQVSAAYETQSGMVIKPALEIRYDYAFGDDNALVNSAIAGINNANFTTFGAGEARSSVSLGAGVALDFNQNVSAHVQYNGSYSSSTDTHQASAGLTFKF